MNNSLMIKGIRRKKSTLSEVKVAVIGAPGVGKSALIVRFLTRRYIGEYVHEGDVKYKHEVIIDEEPVLIEVMDLCPKTICEYPTSDVYQWADCLALTYAITDRESFEYLEKLKPVLNNYCLPIILIANKADLVHLRKVNPEEGEIMAKEFDCLFREVTAAEQITQIIEVFNTLCREVLFLRRKNKQSLLDRMLGNKSSTPVRTYARGKSDSALPKE